MSKKAEQMLTACDQHVIQLGVLKGIASKACRLKQRWHIIVHEV